MITFLQAALTGAVFAAGGLQANHPRIAFSLLGVTAVILGVLNAINCRERLEGLRMVPGKTCNVIQFYKMFLEIIGEDPAGWKRLIDMQVYFQDQGAPVYVNGMFIARLNGAPALIISADPTKEIPDAEAE